MAKRFFISTLVLLACSLMMAQDYKDNKTESTQLAIEHAFAQAQKEKADNPLLRIEESLSKKTGNLWTYWKAYCSLYKSYYYAASKQQEKAKEALDTGINFLEQEKRMTTEDYALLAYMQSQSIRYTTGIESGVIASKSRNNAWQSVKIDASNLRGWYVLAVIDYYTPKQFGGREKCEEYLLKAISLPAQSIKNKYLPDWGKVESYMLLINFYIEAGNSSKAKVYYDKAIVEFPNNSTLKSYEQKL